MRFLLEGSMGFAFFFGNEMDPNELKMVFLSHLGPSYIWFFGVAVVNLKSENVIM